MKPLVIYHADCADGFGAAFAAWLKLGDGAEYQPMQYRKDTSPDMMAEKVRGREVYILDFSFEKLVIRHIFKAAKCVVWLDHHKSSFEMWCEGFEKGDRFEAGPLPSGQYILLDDNKSGALLAWEYFHPDTEVPMLFRLIDDYDRWQFKLRSTREINKAIWSHAPWAFHRWQWWLEDDTDALIQLEDQGESILRAHNQNVQAVVKDATRRCVITIVSGIVDVPQGETYAQESFAGLSANCPPHLTSDVGHELAMQSGTFGLLWYMDKDGACKCSLRSNGDYDVSAIAKAFGGGGHRNSAGFTTDIHTLLGWIK